MHDDFGELRSLAHGAPSAAAWAAMCEAVLIMPEARREEAIDYLAGTLRGWPDALRVLPGGPFVIPGTTKPLLRLARESRLLIATEAHARWVAGAEALGQHTTLTLLLDDALPAEALAEVLASPHLGRVEALRLVQQGMDVSQLEALCASPALERLERLSLGSLSLTPGALGVLARSALARGLRELTLHNPTGWIAAHDGPHLAAPDEADPYLDETFTRPTPRAPLASYLRALDHPHLAGLTRLQITRVTIDAEAVRTIEALACAPSLRALHLLHSTLEDEPASHALAEALARLPALEALGWDSGHSAHARWPHPAAMPDLLPWARTGRVRALSLNHTPLLIHLPDNLRALGEALAPGIEDLRLFGGQSAHGCVVALLGAREGQWPALTRLTLVHNNLSMQTVDWIAASLHAPRLRHLDLYDLDSTTARRDALRASPTLPDGLSLGLLDELALPDASAPPLVSDPPPPRTLRERIVGWLRRGR